MVQQYRTSKEPENAEDHFQACPCKAISTSSNEGLPETKLGLCKVCRLSQEAALCAPASLIEHAEWCTSSGFNSCRRGLICSARLLS